MVQTQVRSVSAAFGRLRRAVIVCAWLIGLCIGAQTIVWSLATFTEMRYEIVEPETDAPRVVRADEDRRQNLRALAGAAGVDPAAAGAVGDDPQPQRVPSAHDRRFATCIRITGTVGVLATLALLPLMAVGTMLAAGSATPGIERTVSSLTWSIVLALLILPIGELTEIVDFGGALVRYEEMVADVEASRANEPGASGLMFYLRYLLLPGTCAVGAAFVGLRFCAGIEAALVQDDSLVLDPALEQEVARIKPGSLHGAGRSAAALGATLGSGAPVPPLQQPPNMPSATQVSPGNAPKRLI